MFWHNQPLTYLLKDTKQMASNIKAQIASVNLGRIQIEGLLGTDSKFYVAVPQIADSFQILNHNASRDIKAMMGGDFQFLKATTPLHPKAVNVVTIDQFQRILIELSIKGNAVAIEVLRDMSALGLHQLFCDAFGIQLDAEDRALWLQRRTESKELFWELANQIKVWMDGRECTAPPHTYYSNAFDCVNMQLFGKKSKDIREEVGVSALTRDCFGKVALRHVNIVQSGAARMMAKENVKPTDAIKHIVTTNYIEVGNYSN
jgi:hypothetical protein